MGGKKRFRNSHEKTIAFEKVETGIEDYALSNFLQLNFELRLMAK